MGSIVVRAHYMGARATLPTKIKMFLLVKAFFTNNLLWGLHLLSCLQGNYIDEFLTYILDFNQIHSFTTSIQVVPCCIRDLGSMSRASLPTTKAFSSLYYLN